MKRMLTGLAALLVFGSGVALAANPEPFTVQIRIRQAITITKVTDLDFGAVDAGLATYTVTPSGGAQAGAGTGAVAASFTIQGEAGQVADVSFTADPVTISFAGNNIFVSLNPQAATHNFSGAAETFYVGGQLSLAGTEPAGLYTGTTSLQLVYQ